MVFCQLTNLEALGNEITVHNQVTSCKGTTVHGKNGKILTILSIRVLTSDLSITKFVGFTQDLEIFFVASLDPSYFRIGVRTMTLLN